MVGLPFEIHFSSGIYMMVKFAAFKTNYRFGLISFFRQLQKRPASLTEIKTLIVYYEILSKKEFRIFVRTDVLHFA